MEGQVFRTAARLRLIRGREGESIIGADQILDSGHFAGPSEFLMRDRFLKEYLPDDHFVVAIKDVGAGSDVLGQLSGKGYVMNRRIESHDEIISINPLALSLAPEGFGWPDDHDIFTTEQPPELRV